jgi:hypothetical protein
MPSPTPASKVDVPDQLDSDMSPGDLIEVLEHLPFGERGTALAPVLIDKGVADYLINRIKPHTPRSKLPTTGEWAQRQASGQ